MTAMSRKPQKSLTIASFSAMAMLVSVTAGVVSNLPASDPAWRAPTQISRAQMAQMIGRKSSRSSVLTHGISLARWKQAVLCTASCRQLGRRTARFRP